MKEPENVSVQGRRYIVVVSGFTKKQESALTKRLKETPKVDWWHWLKNTWLLLDQDTERVPEFWHRVLIEITREPEAYFLILEVRGRSSMAARIPATSSDWLMNLWEPGFEEWSSDEEA